MSKAFESAQGDQNQISDDLKKVEVEVHNIRNEYKEKIDAVLSYQKFNGPSIAQIHFDMKTLEDLVNMS